MNPFAYTFRSQLKAFAAGIIAALTYLVALDLPDLTAVGLDDVLEATLAFFISYIAVFETPNR